MEQSRRVQKAKVFAYDSDGTRLVHETPGNFSSRHRQLVNFIPLPLLF